MYRVSVLGRAQLSNLHITPLRTIVSPRVHFTSPLHQQRELSFFFRNSKLRQLEADANANPNNASLQAAYLNELNKHDAHGVVKRFQSHRFACDEATTREYIAALVRTGAVDRMSLSQMAQYVRSTSPKTSDASSITVDTLRTIMTDNIHVSLAAPRTTSMMLWRLVRVLGVMGLVIAGAISVMGSESGDRSILKSGSVHKEYVPSESNKTFKDVRGMDESKEDLQDLVRFLKDPKKFTRLGGKLPKGYLLVGPPGTGKTLLAKAVAGEAGVSFLYASGSDFDEMFVGLGAKRIRALFEAAKSRAPCIVFIDEIDAVGSKRSPMDQSYARMSLNQLLVELDGFDQSNGVVVIGATNFPELLDSALVRPGRFDQMVNIGLPDVNGREDILRFYIDKLPVTADVDVSRIARAMPGTSGAEIENVVNTAALHAAHHKRQKITAQDFDYAQDKVMMGPERKTLSLSKETLNLTAYHESGHALVAALTPGASQIRKATIMPRGSALGMVSYLQNEDQGSLSRRQMLAQIDVAMGGRVAEEIVFGIEKVTSGAASDIRMATRVARAMVTRYGMSDKVGFATTSDVDELKLLSEEQRNVIDHEVRKILQDSHDRAMKLLGSNEELLHRLAKALMERESMTANEIGQLLGLQQMPPQTPVWRREE